MRAPADDEPMPDFGLPGDGPGHAQPGGRRSRDGSASDEIGVLERDRWAMRASATPGRRPRRRAATIVLESDEHADPDRRRYFLSSLQPSGDYEAVIVAITDGSSRRYFSSRDGSHFIEVDELSFEQRRKSGTRSLLEIGEHELRELEGALIFVRPLDGRDPIAEVAAAKKAALEATRPMAILPIAAPGAVDATTDAAAGGTADGPATGDDAMPAEAPGDRDDSGRPSSAAPDESSEGTESPGPRRSTFEPVVPKPPADAPAADADADAGEDADADADADSDSEAPAAADAPAYPEAVIDDGIATADDGADPAAASEPAPSDPALAQAPDPARTWAGPAPVAASVTDVSEPSEPRPAAPRSPESLSTLDAVAQVALAKGIAFAAHRGQLDKSGTPYIDHPGRIAERFDPVTDPIAAAAAWLHDVLEDTPITSRELFEAGVLLEVVGVVELLTRRPEITPDEYYARIRRHPVALRVKLADIDDNTAPWRLRRLDFAKQARLAEKYRHARRALGAD
ncbi:hypothetical protein [Agromyces kandeliae]|uniref:hypothetical protein n=1 Tax=Agromyces kandeliae TaxID=2666141 RepID=UPI001E4C7C0E|nr:hypothetical protein [Agromyces kandeliae]